MRMNKEQQGPAARPEPPDDIEGEALAEWNRICDAAEAVGHPIKDADSSILATYCRTWAVNRQCYKHVQKFGAVIKWPNGMPGPSPQYKTFAETVKLLRGLLSDLGCTPQSRDFDVKTTTATVEPAELDI